MLLTHLRPSSLRFSTASGLRLSARVIFLISLPVCLLPRLCSTCGKIYRHVRRLAKKLETHLTYAQDTFARNPPKWAPILESTFFFLASSSALFFASSSSFLCLSACGAQLSTELLLAFFGQIILFIIYNRTYEKTSLIITASLVCLSRSFSALTRCCSALSALRLSWGRHSNSVFKSFLLYLCDGMRGQDMHYNPFFKSNQLLFFSFPLFKVNINQSLKLQKIFLHPFPVDVLTNSQHKHKLGQILLKGCKCLTVFSRLASKSTRSPSGILGAAICGTTGLKKYPKKKHQNAD